VGCEECLKTCQKVAISFVNSIPIIDRTKCDLCGECAAACPSGAMELAGKSYTVEQLLDEIEKDRVFYEESGGGVTFSGGEPLLQADFLKAVLEGCKKQGIHTALDTSGFVPYEVIDALKANVDLFLYDLKMIDEKRHIHYTGVSNKMILENLKKLSRNGSRILVRIPLIPQVNDTKDCIQKIAAFVAGFLSLKHVSLLPYHAIAAQKYERLNRPSEMPNSSCLPEEKINFIKDILEDTGLHVTIGN